jgi:hypothetical protein
MKHITERQKRAHADAQKQRRIQQRRGCHVGDDGNAEYYLRCQGPNCPKRGANWVEFRNGNKCFVARRGHAKYCSNRCRTAAQRARVAAQRALAEREGREGSLSDSTSTVESIGSSAATQTYQERMDALERTYARFGGPGATPPSKPY